MTRRPREENSDTPERADAPNIAYSFDEDVQPNARIKVIGVGGGGCNAVNRMIEAGIEGVSFAVVNTDEQALRVSRAQTKLQIGSKLTLGRGAGSDPEIGRKAALEDTERIIELLNETDMVFVTAGLGGGTGTGAVPVVANLAKELGALTVAVVTKPFTFEGNRRREVAEAGLKELADTVDTVVTIPNERLLEVVDRGTSFFEAFRIADDVLRQAVQGISDIITIPGIINRDFADVRTIMHGMGYAVMGTAVASGASAAVEAARNAVASPLLEDASIEGARGILINITGSTRLGLHEVHEASTIIQRAADPDANIIFGAVLDDTLEADVKITVIATGFREDATSTRGKHSVARQPVELRPRRPEPVEPRPEPQRAPVAENPPIRTEGLPEPNYQRGHSMSAPPEPVPVHAGPEPAARHNQETAELDKPAIFRRRFGRD